MPSLTLHRSDTQFPIRLERFRIKGLFSLENYFVIFQKHQAGVCEIPFWISPQAHMRTIEEIVEKAYLRYPNEIHGLPIAYGTLNPEKCHFVESYFEHDAEIPFVIQQAFSSVGETCRLCDFWAAEVWVREHRAAWGTIGEITGTHVIRH